MSEQIRIPRQRTSSSSKQEEQRVMTNSEVYAAQEHHREIDQRADDVLDDIQELVDEVEVAKIVRALAIGELAMVA